MTAGRQALEVSRGETLRRRDPFRLSSFAITRRTSLVLADQLPISAWRRVGAYLALLADSSAWWIGDWLVFGAAKYPDRYRQALAETGLDYQTLKNYAWIARKFAPSRRHERLSFQHHAEVAALSESEQDLWLDMAEKLRWSRNQLRANIRVSRSGPPRPLDEASVTVVLNVTSAQEERWREAARGIRKELCEWIVETMDRTAGTHREP